MDARWYTWGHRRSAEKAAIHTPAPPASGQRVQAGNYSLPFTMTGGIPNYILQATRRMFHSDEPVTTESTRKPIPVSASKTPVATRLLINSTLKDAKVAPVPLASLPRGSQPMAGQTRRVRLNAIQRKAIASAVQTAMERLLSNSNDSAKVSAINDMMQEIEGVL